MQIPSKRRRPGFTLIELLVVISIILALSLAVSGGVVIVMNRAKAAATRASALAVVNAVNSFYTDYGALPDVSDKLKTDKGDGTKLLEILLGIEPESTKMQNSRMNKYLDVKETKTKAKGLRYSNNGRSVDGLYDDWGSPFVVELNSGLDNSFRFNWGGKPVTLNGVNIAVYSPGPDKKAGTEDDIKSW